MFDSSVYNLLSSLFIFFSFLFFGLQDNIFIRAYVRACFKMTIYISYVSLKLNFCLILVLKMNDSLDEYIMSFSSMNQC